MNQSNTANKTEIMMPCVRCGQESMTAEEYTVLNELFIEQFNEALDNQMCRSCAEAVWSERMDKKLKWMEQVNMHAQKEDDDESNRH